MTKIKIVKEDIDVGYPIHSEKSIIDLLYKKYSNENGLKLSNMYIFKSDWESDFFVQKYNKYSYEFEIKISRSDFFHDFKKVKKHSILKEGRYNDTIRVDVENYRDHPTRPNKFYYVVPYNLIKIEEIPSYAGLIHIVGNELITVKEAPFLHKEKLDLRLSLCMKFYYNWITEKEKVKKLERKLKK
jgi:hypothetical protein